MRIETDSLGDVEIPDDALYGPASVRGARNFHLVGRPISSYPDFVVTMAKIKQAAARTNREIGALDEQRADSIEQVCQELIDGLHHEHFIVPLAEGSGGTSLNMNFNEVIANRASQILGSTGSSANRIDPNDHINMGQSTNDVLPSAIKLACFVQTAELVSEGRKLTMALQDKGNEFNDVLRVGRTCMQAAQPMTYGQLFCGYASSIERATRKLDAARHDLCAVPMGGTAIGTGLGAHAKYRDYIFDELTQVFGFPITGPDDWFDAMYSSDGFARLANEMTMFAMSMSKVAADLVILSSDKGSGIGEVILPAVQSGSSIMAGKINPVMCLLVQQVTQAVNGDNSTVLMAAMQAQMEINHFEPGIARALFNSMEILANATCLFREKCIDGLQVDAERSLTNLMNSPAISSVFLNSLGYKTVTELVKQASRRGLTFTQVALEAGLLSDKDIESVLRDSVAGGTSMRADVTR